MVAKMSCSPFPRPGSQRLLAGDLSKAWFYVFLRKGYAQKSFLAPHCLFPILLVTTAFWPPAEAVPYQPAASRACLASILAPILRFWKGEGHQVWSEQVLPLLLAN